MPAQHFLAHPLLVTALPATLEAPAAPALLLALAVALLPAAIAVGVAVATPPGKAATLLEAALPVGALRLGGLVVHQVEGILLWRCSAVTASRGNRHRAS